MSAKLGWICAAIVLMTSLSLQVAGTVSVVATYTDTVVVTATLKFILGFTGISSLPVESDGWVVFPQGITNAVGSVIISSAQSMSPGVYLI